MGLKKSDYLNYQRMRNDLAKNTELVIVYEPDKSVRQGYLSLFKEMLQEIRTGKWLTYQLFLCDIRNLYKQSFVGIFWAFIMPFLALGTFAVLGASGVVSLGNINAPYPIYAILGLAFWQVFATGIVACTGALTKAGNMIAKINFPREALVFGSVGQALLGFLTQLVIAIGFFAFYRYVPNWTIVFLPLTFIPLLLFTIGLGLILSIINGVSRDLERIVGVAVSFLLFLTPILYARPATGLLGTMTQYNPVYYLAIAPRDLALSGSLSEPAGYLISVLISVVVFILCWMAFHLTETRISERI